MCRLASTNTFYVLLQLLCVLLFSYLVNIPPLIQSASPWVLKLCAEMLKLQQSTTQASVFFFLKMLFQWRRLKGPTHSQEQNLKVWDVLKHSWDNNFCRQIKGPWSVLSMLFGIACSYEKTHFHGKYSQTAVEEQKVGTAIKLLVILLDFFFHITMKCWELHVHHTWEHHVDFKLLLYSQIVYCKLNT